MIFAAEPWPERAELNVDGQVVSVNIRVNKCARHYRLSLSRAGEPVLSVPQSGCWKEAKAFLNKHRHWLSQRLKNHPEPVYFAHGVEIPFRGHLKRIISSEKLRGKVKILETEEGPGLLVPGGEHHLARRLTDWLKSEARSALEERSSFHASRLDVTFRAVRVRSQSTRWGSCSSAGVLNYNWRLILAPDFVLDYVAAHEVAHRREMNHSKAFWATVYQTLPEMETGRAWLKAHGPALMAYEAGN